MVDWRFDEPISPPPPSEQQWLPLSVIVVTEINETPSVFADLGGDRGSNVPYGVAQLNVFQTRGSCRCATHGMSIRCDECVWPVSKCFHSNRSSF